LALAIVWVGLLLLPADLRPKAENDRWAAEAALFGVGGFLLAIIGTAVAVVAYVNSTEKPDLQLTTVSAAGIAPGDRLDLIVDHRTDFGLNDAWMLRLELTNTGPVAARFVAVRVTLEGAWLWAASSALIPWKSGTLATPHQFFWEGGADAVIHPGWQYQVPTLGPSGLGMSNEQDEVEILIEVIGDDVSLVTRRETLRVARPYLG
jgi:hypothetical protein